MRKLHFSVAIAGVALLSGPSSIASGTSQTLTVNTNPPGPRFFSTALTPSSKTPKLDLTILGSPQVFGFPDAPDLLRCELERAPHELGCETLNVKENLRILRERVP